MLPTIHYAEAVYCIGIAAFLIFHIHNNKRFWKSFLATFVGAFIPIACLFAHNTKAFGAFWKTAYSLTGEQTGFSLKYFVPHSVMYLMNILSEGAGVFTILGLIGIVMWIAQEKRRKLGILLAGLILPITFLYMAYFFPR